MMVNILQKHAIELNGIIFYGTNEPQNAFGGRVYLFMMFKMPEDQKRHMLQVSAKWIGHFNLQN